MTSLNMVYIYGKSSATSYQLAIFYYYDRQRL